MIKSMTGYGKGEGGGFVVEMRSVNHKFLDLSIKLPKALLPLESKLKKAVGDRFSRGRVEIYVTRGGKEEAPRAFRLDREAARQYIAILSDLKNTFDLPGEVDLSLLTSFKDIVTEDEVSEDLGVVWDTLTAPLSGSMNSLEAMRAEEGATLSEDIRKRAAFIAAGIDEVEKKSPVTVQEYARKLKDRVAKLAEGIELDQERLHMEVVIFADRCDITEEVVRARSHLKQLDDMLAASEPVGRKMDFLLQEINREVNTIGSKASDRDVAHRVVGMKAELEKIREQIQNIE